MNGSHVFDAAWPYNISVRKWIYVGVSESKSCYIQVSNSSHPRIALGELLQLSVGAGGKYLMIVPSSNHELKLDNLNPIPDQLDCYIHFQQLC